MSLAWLQRIPKTFPLWWVTSCASLTITSQPPEARIRLSGPAGGTPQELGVTPFEGSLNQLAAQTEGGPYLLKIEKEGYQSESFLLADYNFGDLAINLSLRPVSAEDEAKVWQTYNSAGRLILLAYQQLAEQNQEGARSLADQLEKEYPRVAAAFILKALAYLQEGDATNARANLQKAQNLDPDDPNLRQLIQQLENEGTP